ncbi:MAG: hypothetical protein IT552_12665 [Sphingomonadaceae bacterium]|nr:hypothetical protein [Sphingomonadaceae bacterium]
MSDTKISDFEQIIERAVSRLVSVRHENSGSFVTTPSMYPSGGAVVIWIDRAHPRYFVSDYSFGARECEIMGADKRQFRKHAEPIAEQYGLTLSNDGALEALVSEGQIEGAIKAVANASQEIALSYANRIERRRLADVRVVLVTKLERVFGQASVAKEVEFKGASTTDWQIDARVQVGDDIALFDTVTPWFPSVASTLAKFGDIRLLEHPPMRTAVLSGKEGFGTWITALSQVGNVMDAASSDAAFGRLIH